MKPSPRKLTAHRPLPFERGVVAVDIAGLVVADSPLLMVAPRGWRRTDR